MIVAQHFQLHLWATTVHHVCVCAEASICVSVRSEGERKRERETNREGQIRDLVHTDLHLHTSMNCCLLQEIYPECMHGTFNTMYLHTATLCWINYTSFQAP